MTHRASVRFWDAYNKLAPDLQAQADKQFELLKQDQRHPSLQFKKVGRIWSARVNLAVRALAVEEVKILFGSGLAIIANMSASFARSKNEANPVIVLALVLSLFGKNGSSSNSTGTTTIRSTKRTARLVEYLATNPIYFFSANSSVTITGR